jgi:hypothetical protein
MRSEPCMQRFFEKSLKIYEHEVGRFSWLAVTSIVLPFGIESEAISRIVSPNFDANDTAEVKCSDREWLVRNHVTVDDAEKPGMRRKRK